MGMTGRPEIGILHLKFIQKCCILLRGEKLLIPGGHLNQLFTFIEALSDIELFIPVALIDQMGLHSYCGTA